VTETNLAERHRHLLQIFPLRDLVPSAEIPEQIWGALEARGFLERTTNGYLRLTAHGRATLDEASDP
jgi:ribosomal protein S19E (S16A)